MGMAGRFVEMVSWRMRRRAVRKALRSCESIYGRSNRAATWTAYASKFTGTSQASSPIAAGETSSRSGCSRFRAEKGMEKIMNVGTLNGIKAALGTDRLTDDERIVLAALVRAGHDENGHPTGRAGILSANYLGTQIYPRFWEETSANDNEERSRIENCKRFVRKAVNSLIIKHRISIMCVAGSGGGYYLPATEADVENNHHRFHARAMTGLVKASRSRKSAYADAIVQLSIGYEAEVKRLDAGSTETEGPPAWVSVVTGLLDRVKGDPALYSSEIRRIQDQYGDIFVRRDQVAKIRQLSTELNRALEGLQT